MTSNNQIINSVEDMLTFSSNLLWNRQSYITYITYISGNESKIKEVKRLNNCNTVPSQQLFNLIYKNIDLVEIQGTAEEITKAKCKVAFKIVRALILIEDSSLYFSSLNCLPGPYIKEFMKKIDLNTLANLEKILMQN